MSAKLKMVVLGLGLGLALTGCDAVRDILEFDPFYLVNAQVGGSNRAENDVRIRVSDRDEGPWIKPNGSARFVVEIQVSRPSGSHKSVYDITTNMEVAVHDKRLGLSEKKTCRMGAKVFTSITYSVKGKPPNEKGYVECRTSY